MPKLRGGKRHVPGGCAGSQPPLGSLPPFRSPAPGPHPMGSRDGEGSLPESPPTPRGRCRSAMGLVHGRRHRALSSGVPLGGEILRDSLHDGAGERSGGSQPPQPSERGFSALYLFYFCHYLRSHHLRLLASTCHRGAPSCERLLLWARILQTAARTPNFARHRVPLAASRGILHPEGFCSEGPSKLRGGPGRRVPFGTFKPSKLIRRRGSWSGRGEARGGTELPPPSKSQEILGFDGLATQILMSEDDVQAESRADPQLHRALPRSQAAPSSARSFQTLLLP